MRLCVTQMSARRRVRLLITVFCMALVSVVHADPATITPPSKGYALYFNDKLISLPDNTPFTFDDAQQNCNWNIKNKSHINVQCFYDGELLNSRPSAAVGSMKMDWNTERQGASYYTFTLDSATPIACLNACLQDARCKTWTYFKPNTARRNHAVCLLRDHFTPPTASPHSVSGEK